MESQSPSFNWVVGIDPGVTGGIARIDNAGQSLEVWPMPDTPRGVARVLQGVHYRATVFFLEKVHSGVFTGGKERCPTCKKPRRQQGVKSAFTFGEGFGVLQGALEMLFADTNEPPIHLVLPKQWQTDLNCLTGGDKKISHAFALDLAENIPRTEYYTGRGKMTQALGDTVLIAEWGRRMLRQEVDIGPTF